MGVLVCKYILRTSYVVFLNIVYTTLFLWFLAPCGLADFSCAVESRILLHGRMYVTTTFVCFYSNLFGFEKIIKIPFW